MTSSTTIENRGILMNKPPCRGAPPTSFDTQLIGCYFVGRHHPIDYSPAFHKCLKEEYDHKRVVEVEIDLFSGSTDFREKPANLSFDSLLDYIINQRELFGFELYQIVKDAKVVCRRGVLNKLANAPYQETAEFRFGVKKYRGIYFIKEIQCDKQQFGRYNKSAFLLSKFKKECIRPFGNEEYEPPKEVSTWEQMQGLYFCNLMSQTEELKIFYGSEIDAFDKDLNVLHIKLQNGDLICDESNRYLPEKLRKWYFQTKYLGCDKIVLGCRENNVVTHIKKVKIDTFRSLVPAEKRWKSTTGHSAALTTFSTILDFYENNVISNQTLIVELKQYDPVVKYEIGDDKDYGILPYRFKHAFKDTIDVDQEIPEDIGYVYDTGIEYFDELLQ